MKYTAAFVMNRLNSPNRRRSESRRYPGTYQYQLNAKGLKVKIPITKDKKAIIDDEDYTLIKSYKWRLFKSKYCNHYYALTTVKQKTIFMHQLIMNFSSNRNKQIDHINHNGLDNRKNNLRICTRQQNFFNSLKRKKGSSQYKGVCYFKPRNTWQARITYNYKTFCLGYFKKEIDAALAYNKTAQDLFKEYAQLNII